MGFCKIIKAFFWFIGVVTFIIGLAGMPEDISTWKGWWGSTAMTLDQERVRLILTGFGLFLIIYLQFCHKHIWPKIKSLFNTPTLIKDGPVSFPKRRTS